MHTRMNRPGTIWFLKIVALKIILCSSHVIDVTAAELGVGDRTSEGAPGLKIEQIIQLDLTGQGMAVEGRLSSKDLELRYDLAFERGSMQTPRWSFQAQNDPYISFGMVTLDTLGGAWHRPWTRPVIRQRIPVSSLSVDPWGFLDGESPMVGMTTEWDLGQSEPSSDGRALLSVAGALTVPSLSLSTDQRVLLDLRYRRGPDTLEVYGVSWDEGAAAVTPDDWYVGLSRGVSRRGAVAGVTYQRSERAIQALIHVQRNLDKALAAGTSLGTVLEARLGDLDLSVSTLTLSPNLPLYHYEDSGGHYDDSDLLSARWVTAGYSYGAALPVELQIAIEERLYRYPVDIYLSRPAERAFVRKIVLGSSKGFRLNYSEKTLYRYEVSPMGTMSIIHTSEGSVTIHDCWSSGFLVRLGGAVKHEDRGSQELTGYLELSGSLGPISLTCRLVHDRDRGETEISVSAAGQLGPIKTEFEFDPESGFNCALTAKIVTF